MENIILQISMPLSSSPLSRLRRMVRYAFAILTSSCRSKTERELQFAQILKNHNGMVSGICFAYSNNREDFNDLRQDILLNIWKGLETYRGEANLTTWLYRVALNTCVSTIRKKKISTTWLEMAVDIPDTNDSSLNENIALLHSCIALLSPLDKAIITMWLDQRKYEEIAEITGISRNNVAIRINRIKSRLTESFQHLDR